jgi:hypothetical protein
MPHTSEQIEQRRGRILRQFRASITRDGQPDGKLPRPKRYGQVVALLAQIYGMYQLELRGASDVVPAPEFAQLMKRIHKALGSYINEVELDEAVNAAEELWTQMKDD